MGVLRRFGLLGVLVAGAGVGSGCFAEPFESGPTLTLTTTSGEPLSQVAAVERFILSGAALEPDAVWLVEGEVSSVSTGRMRDGDVPGVVEEARRPLAVWWDDEGRLTIAPTEVLTPGGRYSLLALGYGLIGTVDVRQDELKVLYRWGPEQIGPGQSVAYCRAKPPFWLESSTSESSSEDEDCTWIQVPEDQAGFFLPPPAHGNWLIDPTPVWMDSPSLSDLGAPFVPECSDEADLHIEGMGCVSLVPGAISVALRRGYFHVAVTPVDASGAGSLRGLLASDGKTTPSFGPLLPGHDYEIVVTDLQAPESPTSSSFRTGPRAARFVLTEVLADPIGPEPAAEWVEIVNLGSGPGSVSGLFIWDDAGGSALPDVELDVGQYGLVVRPDFDFRADGVPAPEALAIVVSTIGQNGLRNSGEEVVLRNAAGDALSTILPRKVPEGTSLARVIADAPDVAESFAPHPEPGSSPGAANP